MSLDRPVYDNPLLRDLRETYAPLLDKIAAESLQRELDGELPFAAVRLLKEAGFGALRVPIELRRPRGLDHRSHAALDRPRRGRRQPAAGAARALRLRRGPALAARAGAMTSGVWFERFVAGEIAGNAWSEVGSTAIDTQQTVLTPGDGAATASTARSSTRPARIYRRVGRRLRPPVAADCRGRLRDRDRRHAQPRASASSTTGTASVSAAPAAARPPSSTSQCPSRTCFRSPTASPSRPRSTSSTCSRRSAGSAGRR